MEIKRVGSQPPGKGPAEYFTGVAHIGSRCQASDPAHALGSSVTFEPGARTTWHSHRLGQTLIVTASWGLPTAGAARSRRCIWGRDLVRGRGKHWHGAMPTTAVTYIAIQEQLDGKAVDWLEKVSDEQYDARG